MKLTRLALAIAVLGSILGVTFLARPVAADCLTLPTGAQLVVKLDLEAAGTYRLWVRQVTPAAGNQLFTSVDGGCATPIAKNMQSDKLSWSGSDNNAQPLLLTLAEGEHNLVLAGDYTGIAVDLGLLTTDQACIPQETGQNCFTTEQSAGEVVLIPDEPVVVPEELSEGYKLGLALAIASLIAMLGTVGFLVRHYLGFIKKVVPPPLGVASPLTHKIKHALSLSTLQQFFNHHRSTVMIYGGAFIVFCILFVVGVATAEPHRAVIFEAENGTVSGEATVVVDAQASNGSYVLFGGSPPVITGSAKTPDKATSTPSGGSGPQTGGGGGGGSGGGGNPSPEPGGGGGGTPVGECPPFPAFPDESCTGWQHTGVTLKNCDNLIDTNATDGWIWDDNPIKTFDSCYFSKTLTIQATGITITRSQIHGVISYHGSNGYSLKGLQLIDVEIEQEDDHDNARVAVSGGDWSCLRCNVHHTVSGLHFGDNTHIRDSYTHDFHWQDGSHGAGIGTGQDHGSNSSIIHNNIQCNRVDGPPICSSALSIYPEDENGDGQTIKNVEVKENLFNATGAYCVYAVSIPNSNINFVNNVFGKKFYPGCAGYGPVTGYGSAGGAWTNNVWAGGPGYTGQVDPFGTY